MEIYTRVIDMETGSEVAGTGATTKTPSEAFAQAVALQSQFKKPAYEVTMIAPGSRSAAEVKEMGRVMKELGIGIVDVG